jgi:hypothetical protein
MTERDTPDLQPRNRLRLVGHRLEQMRAQIRLELGRIPMAAADVQAHLGQRQAAALQGFRHASCQTCLVHPIEPPLDPDLRRGVRKS